MMTHWLRLLVGPIRQWTKDRRDHVLARFRAHVVLALADDFRQLADDFRQLAAAQQRSERQMHELNLFVDVLAREILRLQRQVDELAPPSGSAAAKAVPARQGHDSSVGLVA